MFFLLLSIILILVMCNHLLVFAKSTERNELSENEARAYANEMNTWVICYQQGTRTSNFYQYDATSSCLYFSYSKHGCVDVYDTEGVFLYSIIFPERQNGGISVRCENNQVYISAKDNTLYIFMGAEEVAHMDYDTAAQKGYDFFWFEDNDPCISVDGNWIRLLDETGDLITQIPTPSVIKKTMPPSGAAMIAIPMIAVTIVLFLLIIKILVHAITKCTR